MKSESYILSPEEIGVSRAYFKAVDNAISGIVEEFLKKYPDRYPCVRTLWEGTTLRVEVTDGGPAPRDWVIVKNGYFYRENRAGYTSSILEAGHYTAAEAKMEVDAKGWPRSAFQ